MRVLVTGGGGAIGTFVARALRDRGDDVTAFDLVDCEIPGVRSVTGDVTDEAAVARAVEGADAVVHLAALLPDACAADPRRAERVNVGGSLTVFEAAAEAGVRVVYASSKAAFGVPTGVHGPPTYEPMGEDAPKDPHTVYGATKLAVERLADAYRRDGADLVGLRFASTYGPGKGAAHGDLAYVPGLIRRAAAGERVEVVGADQPNDFVYYGDVARGVAAALEAEDPAHAVYHVGSGETVTLRAFADALRAETDAAVTVEGGTNFRDADPPTYCRLDVSRARADLGYEPAYPVDRAVADFVEKVRAGGT